MYDDPKLLFEALPPISGEIPPEPPVEITPEDPFERNWIPEDDLKSIISYVPGSNFGGGITAGTASQSATALQYGSSSYGLTGYAASSKPSKPQVTAAAGSTEIVLRWGSFNAERFEVYQYINGAFKMIYKCKANVSTYTVSRLQSNTTYYFCVVAFKGQYYAISDVAKATTGSQKPNPPTPTPPEKVTATLSGGVLQVVGTQAADTILIKQTNSQIVVEGVRAFDKASVKRITVDAGGGNDTVGLFHPDVTEKVFATGGTGTDKIWYVGKPGQLSSFEYSYAERWQIDASFENLRGNYQVIGPANSRYNCIAWSLGITDRWVWPGKGTLADFDKQNQQYGYTRMIKFDVSLQRGIEKIVLFGKIVNGKFEATHQAKQEKDGTWTSKCGVLALIKHPDLNGVAGQSYGKPYYVYYRARR